VIAARHARTVARGAETAERPSGGASGAPHLRRAAKVGKRFTADSARPVELRGNAVPSTAEDRDEILQLLYRYNHASDSGDAEGWADTFTDDAVFDAAGQVISGREALVEFASAVRGRRWRRIRACWRRRCTASTDNEEASYPSKTLTASYAFSQHGTYLPALRVTSQRRGEMNSPHGRVENLGRVRVVVK
jgi:hypothetical protein